jgi:uncharacterized protein (TIGR03435 family)
VFHTYIRLLTRNRAGIVVLFILCGFSASARAQAPGLTDVGVLPSFEVASIRPSGDSGSTRSASRFTPGRYSATNISLRELLRNAFGLAILDQVRGGPGWLVSRRFDIQAIASGAPSQDRMQLMLRRLLIERFKLNMKLVNDEFPVLALRTKAADRRGKQSLQLNIGGPCQIAKDVQEGQGPCGEVFMGSDVFVANGVSMARLAEVLSRSPTLTGSERLVLDQTGLSGAYSFQIKFARQARPGLRVSESSGLPEFSTALEEQLGLTLTPARAPVAVLIVEGATAPVLD